MANTPKPPAPEPAPDTAAAALKAAACKPSAGPYDGPGELQRGIAALVGVNILWALLPAYWKQLSHIPPMEVVCHRSFWGFLVVLVLLWGRGGLREALEIVKNRRTLKFMIGCSMGHTFGWGFYIWAVSSGHIVDAALGSYILPLLTVLCGTFIFKERPRNLQWIAIATAAVGVVGMIVFYNSLPWVGLISASNSVLFATLRKKAPVNAIPGLVVELLISAPLLWGYLAYLTVTGQGALGRISFDQDLWLIGAGIVTIIPQMGYAFALCRVPLTSISLIQYIPPTGNFLLGIFLFGEHFTPDKVFGFTFIWIGLLIFTIEGLLFYRSKRKLAYGPSKDQ